MARMQNGATKRRERRTFTDEFKVGAVRLVLDEGKTISAAAQDLDLSPSVLANWVRQGRADRSNGKTGLTSKERAELARLRKEELSARGITCSMSRRGNCYDNAVAESWFSTFKFELGEKFDSYAQAKEKSFDYIEVFYNQQRLHSSLGYLSPAQFERQNRGVEPMLRAV